MEKKNCFALRGEVAYSKNEKEIAVCHRGYVVCENGMCKGVFETLPSKYADIEVLDYHNMLIVPGMADLHVHAPQYTFRGIGMDLELLEWLNKHTFPEEAKYSDIEYAKQSYSFFTEDLRRCFTTRAVIFATIHNDSTIALMDMLEKTGLVTYVGKVNMNRNSDPSLTESSCEASLTATKEWLEKISGKYENTFPIITPRFIPSCSDDLMQGLSKLAKENNLRIQSHLSENMDEIAWVKELVPKSDCYANAYEIFGAMSDEKHPSIMAHCVYSDEREMEIMKKYGTYVAHCPDSNMNLSSGIAPIRKFLDAGLKIGLGTDVAAGSSMNMLKTMLCALQVSKMYYRMKDTSVKPLTFEEVFYLATIGGGSYFGKVGSFAEDYEFDAVVIDDSMMASMREMSIRERVERMVYNDSDCFIRDKYVKGKRVFSR